MSVEIQTDGAGNVINPEIQYKALKTELELASNSSIAVDLIQPSDTGYREWFLRIYTEDSASFSGGSTSVSTSGGSINPLFTDISTETNISSRNLTLLDKDGNTIDLGAVSQIDELILSGTYTVGETFLLNFCGDEVYYEVGIENSAECVAKGIVSAISDKTTGLFSEYVVVTRDVNKVIFTSKEAGVPINVNVSYPGPESFIYSSVVDNVSSMSLPSLSGSNDIVYETNERGGEYKAILTVVSDCDYSTSEKCFSSWCYDLTEFDCCFVDLVNKNGCCCKTKDKQREISSLRNILIAIPIMIKKGFADSEVQKVVDMGWSICQPLKCECKTC